MNLPKFRLLLIPVFLIGAIISILIGLESYIAFFLVFTAFVLLFSHFRHGSILVILLALKKGNISKAQKIIQGIKRPQWLSPKYRSYYYFALSLIATYSQDLEGAAANAQKSLDFGILPANEQSILYYNLARVAFEKKQWSDATKFMLELEKNPSKDLHLKKRIEELKKALENR